LDPFIAFIIFALLIVLDILAQQRWLAPYYSFGLPVSYSRKKLTTRIWLKNGAAPSVVFTDAAAQDLEERFRGRPAHPSIQFHPLPGGGLAFREKLFENRGGFKYLPVMHSTARLNPERGQVSVTGYLNLWLIFTLGYVAYRVAIEPSFVPVALLALVVLLISYAAQHGLNRQVATSLSEASVSAPTGKKA